MDALNFIFNENLIKNKLYSLNSSDRITIDDRFFTRSAVLFTIIPHENEPYELVVIHRANKGSRHRGEMSFPGGKVDPEDVSLKDTALREAEEEIGVPRCNPKIIGCLHDLPTMSRFIITPFVATIEKDQKLVKDEREVQKIVKVPINFFFNEKHFREQALDIEGKKFPVYYFNYKYPEDGKIYTIWGATANMIVKFIEIVYGHSISKLGLERFNVEEIKELKDYIKNDFNKNLAK